MANNMTFTDFVTPVPADWLNNVNFVVNQYPYSNNVAFTYPATGGVTRTGQSKWSDSLSLLDFGAVGNDSADDTLALNVAISVANITNKSLFIPATTAAYRLTSTINILQNLVIYGEGCRPSIGPANSTTFKTRGPGSWFHLDHTGVGFNAGNVPNQFETHYTGIGTIRNQPVPNGAATYTPNSNDYDFYNNGCDLYMEDIVPLNPTKFSYTTGGSRAIYEKIRGQPLRVGIYTDTAFDVCRYNNIHFWPWWSEAPGVMASTVNFASAFITARNDSPMLSNFFTYAYMDSIRFTSNVQGTTTRMEGTNLQFDFTYNGIFVDATVQGATAVISNLTSTGYGGVGSTIVNAGILFDPASQTSEFRLVNSHFSVYGGNAVRVYGTSNNVWLTQTKVQEWNKSGVGYPAIEAGSNNTIHFSDIPYCVAPTGTPTTLSATGSFRGLLGWGFITATTNAAGEIVIPHGLGATPTGVLTTVMNAGTALTGQMETLTSTTATMKFFTCTTGAPVNTQSIAFLYQLVY